MPETKSKAPWLLGCGGCAVVLLVVVVAAGLGAASWLGSIFEDEPRDRIADVDCGDGAGLRLTYARRVNHFAGVTTHKRVEGELLVDGDSFAFGLDGLHMPEHVPEARLPPGARYGEGAAFVHVFLDPSTLSEARADRAERCMERHAQTLLAAIEGVDVRMSENVPATQRARAYWRATPAALTPSFRDGDRELRVERDGKVVHLHQGTETWVGAVDRLDGQLRVRCCGSYGPTDPLRFRDAEGRTLADYFGVPITPGFDPW